MLDLEQLRKRAVDRGEIPSGERLCCVYFLFDEDRLIYIGSTTFLSRRLRGHGRKQFQRVAFVEPPDNKILALETEYQRAIPTEAIRPRDPSACCVAGSIPNQGRQPKLSSGEIRAVGVSTKTKQRLVAVARSHRVPLGEIARTLIEECADQADAIYRRRKASELQPQAALC